MFSALSNSAFEKILNSASDAIIVAEAGRKILFFNAQAQRMIGYAHPEIIGNELSILVPEKFTQFLQRKIEEFLGAGVDAPPKENPTLLTAQRSDRVEFPVEVTLSKVEVPEGVLVAAIVRDCSAQQESQRVLLEKTQELQIINETLLKVDKVKNQFLGMAAHDLRNPLTTIRNGATMLLDDVLLPPQREKILHIIHSSADAMLSLVSDLLDVNRIESGHLELVKQTIDGTPYFNSFVESQELIAQKKNISICLQLEGDLRAITLDPKRIHQVLENFMSNAIKFSNPGTRIELVVKSAADALEVFVKDQGVGIPEEEIPQLFGAFRQLSPHATAGEKGTGLGLVIAEKIIELHGGTISVSSTLGKGSTFGFRIPRS